MWSPSPLCTIAVEIDRDCTVKDSISPGPFGLYTAVCEGGVARATVLVHDKLFGSNNKIVDASEICEDFKAVSDSVEYIFTIPCMMEDCVTEGFGGDEAETWLYGAKKWSKDFVSY